MFRFSVKVAVCVRVRVMVTVRFKAKCFLPHNFLYLRNY